MSSQVGRQRRPVEQMTDDEIKVEIDEILSRGS
jgi:hypothetical protein